MLVLAHGYSFETLVCSRKAFPGRPTRGERKTNFLVHFLGSSTSTGQISLKNGLAQSSNESFSSHKISELNTLPSLNWEEIRDQATYQEMLNKDRSFREIHRVVQDRPDIPWCSMAPTQKSHKCPLYTFLTALAG